MVQKGHEHMPQRGEVKQLACNGQAEILEGGGCELDHHIQTIDLLPQVDCHRLCGPARQSPQLLLGLLLVKQRWCLVSGTQQSAQATGQLALKEQCNAVSWSALPAPWHGSMRFESTVELLAECKLKYYKISSAWALMPCRD